MTGANATLKIDTPENVTFDYEVAGIGSRFLAALVDTGLIILLQAILFGTALLIADTLLNGEAFDSMKAGWLLAIVGIFAFLFLWGYYIFFEILWNGQSPGKRWVGLRVIRLDGTPVTTSEVVIRNLVRIIDFLPTAYGVGVVVMFIDSKSRRVGDFTAGTIVVHDREVKELEELSPVLKPSPFGKKSWQGDIPDGFPIERITEDDLQIIGEFLSRRGELSNHTALANHLFKTILLRLELPDVSIPPVRAERVLEAIYRARRANAAQSPPGGNHE